MVCEGSCWFVFWEWFGVVVFVVDILVVVVFVVE